MRKGHLSAGGVPAPRGYDLEARATWEMARKQNTSRHVCTSAVIGSARCGGVECMQDKKVSKYTHG